MSDSPVRIGFVSADHLHFPGLLRQAIEAPNIEVVGMVIDDADHRAPRLPQALTCGALAD